jgi:hypothetical protein
MCGEARDETVGVPGSHLENEPVVRDRYIAILRAFLALQPDETGELTGQLGHAHGYGGQADGG